METQAAAVVKFTFFLREVGTVKYHQSKQLTELSANVTKYVGKQDTSKNKISIWLTSVIVLSMFATHKYILQFRLHWRNPSANARHANGHPVINHFFGPWQATPLFAPVFCDNLSIAVYYQLFKLLSLMFSSYQNHRNY